MKTEFIEGLKKEEQELLQQLLVIRSLIEKHINKSTTMTESLTVSQSAIRGIKDFPSSLAERVSYVLRSSNRFLHVREIADIIVQNDNKLNVDAIVKALSPLLSRLKRDDKLVNYKIDKSNQSMVWGVAKWLNEDGTIKKENMYDESILVNIRSKFEI